MGSPERGEFAGLGQIHQNGITESKSYDAASQLLANTHLNGSTPVTGHGYTLDSTGRRTAETFTDGTTPNRSYGYDLADQVTSANYGSGQIDAYAYDPAGNRSTATIASRGGSSTTYTANSANQYSTISGMPAPSHDSNGNLTSQNGVTYTWDSENRLLSVSDGVKKIENSYDGQHRRVLKRVLDLASSSLESELHYVYDGWNVIEESTLISSTATLIRTRTWGNDLSGSMQGAGGVGGLLLTEEIGTSTTAYHFQYDGNGNVTEITDLSGNRAASYRYDAFGNTLVATGSYAASNKYRFSTKPLDGEVTNAPLYYYAYRFYDPVTGRWPSRDPIEEDGGVNLYGFVKNNALKWIDVVGHSLWSGQEEESVFGPPTTDNGLPPGFFDTLPSGLSGFATVEQAGKEGARVAAGFSRDFDKKFNKKPRTGIQWKREFAGLVCHKCDKTTGNLDVYQYTKPHPGLINGPFPKFGDNQRQYNYSPQGAAIGQSSASSDPNVDYTKDINGIGVTCESALGKGWEEVGYYHSHPFNSGPNPSAGDLANPKMGKRFLGWDNDQGELIAIEY